jgi:hypothetical protein
MPFDEELFALAMDHTSGPELPALKKRFKGFSICKDMATAAAFGYLAAMRDQEKENAAEETTIFDRVFATIEHPATNACETTEIIMGLVFLWLKEEFIEEGFAGTTIDFLEERFASYVKPSVLD